MPMLERRILSRHEGGYVDAIGMDKPDFRSLFAICDVIIVRKIAMRKRSETFCTTSPFG